MGLIVAVVVVPHMFHCAPVAFAETFAKRPAIVSVDGRAPVHFVIIGIGTAVFAHVMPGGFNAFVVSAALRIALFRRRLVPTVVITILGDNCTGERLSRESVRLDRAGERNAESKQGWCDPFLIHERQTSSFKA